MVEQQLLKQLKAKMDAGVAAAKPEDTMGIFEFMNQLAKDNEDMKDELEDKDIMMQIVIDDIDKKYWVKLQKESVKYGEGAAPSEPNFTWTAPFKIAAEVVYGITNPQNAFMNGTIKIGGKLRDAMAFQSVLDIAMDEFKTLTEG